MGTRRRKTAANAPSNKADRHNPEPPRHSDKLPADSWYASKRPVLRFVLVFALLMGLFFAVWSLPVVRDHWFPRYLEFNAWAGAAGIRLFGHDAQATQATISSPRCSILIARGCDAIEPIAIFLAALLAFPASWRARIVGGLAGACLLLILNQARIVSLFFVRMHRPDWFHVMHVDVWQSAFIFLALLLWLIWAFWATRRRAVIKHAT
jgi:exosortase/archaeosortase family protein